MTSRFADLLKQQIRNEFTACQQYTAMAVWFDAQDLPRLAAHFYRQAIEERSHAMMIVQYMLDRDIPVKIPGVDEVRNTFDAPRELLALALEQEEAVTAQVKGLFTTARQEGDVLGEQFMLWFVQEQVEEVASMKTLLTICDRAGDDWFQVENHLAREAVGDSGKQTDAPRAAGVLL
jgi:bacterioferritin B